MKKHAPIIKNKKEWNNFIKNEHLELHTAINVQQVKLKKYQAVVLLLLRVYIVSILILLALDFFHII